MAEAPMNVCMDFRYGKIMFPRLDEYIGRSLMLYGEYSEEEAAFFDSFIAPGDTVVEVGANLGAHTVHLAQLAGPTGRVYAFEPQRLMFQLLCGNMAINSITNVHCLQKCVGDAPGKMRVPVLDPAVAHNWGGLSLLDVTEGEEVPRITLDSLHLTRCDFLKIDVEGMEPHVLRGATHLLETFHPVVYTEALPDMPSIRVQFEILRQLGYRIYHHCPLLFNPDNYRGCKDDVFTRLVPGPDGTPVPHLIASFNWVCVHPARTQLDGLPEVLDPDHFPG